MQETGHSLGCLESVYNKKESNIARKLTRRAKEVRNILKIALALVILRNAHLHPELEHVRTRTNTQNKHPERSEQRRTQGKLIMQADQTALYSSRQAIAAMKGTHGMPKNCTKSMNHVSFLIQSECRRDL